MVFGQLYVAFAQPMGTNTQMLKVDLKNIRSSTNFDAVMNQIAGKSNSKYNQMLRRTRLAARIDAVAYMVLGVLIGLYMYYSTPESERTAGQLWIPIAIAGALSAVSLVGAAFPVVAMMGYRSTLAEMVDVCGADLGTGVFDACWNKYAGRQARLRAARIQANAARDAARTQAAAIMSVGNRL
tara:strand:+ start:21 stop:569 length:549 start_codon:yes stop_codon:yes gene_type:complete